MPSSEPRPPTKDRLRRYGLTAEEWCAIWRRQGGVCAVCGRLPASGRLNTDHDHVKGWKTLPPEQRKLHVRGLLCSWCNGKLAGWRVTLRKAEALVAYLRAHEARLTEGGGGLWR